VDNPALAAKIDELLSGFLRKLPREIRLATLRALAGSLSGDQIARLLKASPFEHDTWLFVDEQEPGPREAYWRDVYPGWLRSDSPDLNEAVDRLLEAGRPRAAFQAVHMAFGNVETSRLKRLLEHAGTRDGEVPGTYRLDPHYISEALRTLNGRSGVARDEMARLEFLFIRALDRAEHGIPNLERKLVESPRLFVQVLALAFRRSDDGEDPPEWRIQNEEQRQALALAAYTLLDRIRRIPGTDENGVIKDPDLRTWVTETRALCRELGRADIGDQKIGQVLSEAPAGADGIWPCEPVRHVLEDVASREIGIGIGVAVCNARGMHHVKDDAADERALAEKYRAWSRKLAFGHPYMATVLEEIALRYDREAEWWISDAAVRRRLRGW
jgi:hypothetical protein